MEIDGASSSSNTARNMREKLRRMRMKQLYDHLSSLVPPYSSRLQISELIDRTRHETEQLKERIRKLEMRKSELQQQLGNTNNGVMEGTGRAPVISMSMSSWESVLEINLTVIHGGQRNSLKLSEILCVIEEEGARVVHVDLHNVDNRAFCIIKSQAISPRIGIETSRIEERLKNILDLP